MGNEYIFKYVFKLKKHFRWQYRQDQINKKNKIFDVFVYMLVYLYRKEILMRAKMITIEERFNCCRIIRIRSGSIFVVCVDALHTNLHPRRTQILKE